MQKKMDVQFLSLSLYSLVILLFDLKVIATEIIFARFVVLYIYKDHIKNREKSRKGKVVIYGNKDRSFFEKLSSKHGFRKH